MSIVNGKNVTVRIYDNGAYRLYACATSCSISVSTSTVETSVTGSGNWASFMPQKHSWSGSLDGMANLYYAVQGQKMNQIMKILTIVSSVFIPLTFIVGVYGMNFKYMPELNYKYGYFITLISMLILVIILISYFKKICITISIFLNIYK